MNQKPLLTTQRIEAELRSRFNPLPDLDGTRLNAYLTEYRAGYLRNMALTMQAIEETDDTLAAVIPKTKSAACRHGYEILTVETDDEAQATAAKEQKEALEYFYNELRVTSALDRDAAGGVRLLLTQMMDAKGKGYAAHNLVWQPRPDGRYTVQAIFTPLWFFESRHGQLRFLATANAYDGEELEPGAWLISKSSGVPLLIPSAIAYLYKTLPKQDWLVYSARHGMPILEAVVPDNVTDGTAEWAMAEDAIKAAATGQLAWVRNQSTAINAIQIGAQGPLPYPALIERMDRALAAIWRGGDLSTMSKDGQAVGSNSQGSEADALAADDAEWLSETLRLKLDRLVLDYVFGPETPALAYIQVLSAPTDNSAADLKTDQFLLTAGFPLSVKAASERYRRPLPEEDDDLLAAPAPQGAGSQETGGRSQKAQNESELVADNRDGFVTIDGHVVFVGPEKDTTGGEVAKKGDKAAPERADGKPVWMKTRAQVLKENEHRDDFSYLENNQRQSKALREHEDAVRAAIKKGLSVPSEVLQSYPRLAKNTAPRPQTPDPRPLAVNTLADHLGVPLAWLAPVRTELAAMIAAVENEHLSDAALLKFLRHATNTLPELFDRMDIGGLADALEGSLGNAALAGVRASLRAKAGNRDATPAQNASLQSSAMAKFQSDAANGVKTPPGAQIATQRVPTIQPFHPSTPTP